jgi:hypothetical protein
LRFKNTPPPLPTRHFDDPAVEVELLRVGVEVAADHQVGGLGVGGGGDGRLFSAGPPWFGLVFVGLVWFGLVFVGLVWFVFVGLVWFGLVFVGLVWFGLRILLFL